ncbi:MAG: hypothetical protein AAF901_13295, partial [Bacteroidota bacterium]
WFYDKDLDWYRMDRGVIEEDGIIYAEVTVEYVSISDCEEQTQMQKTTSYPIEYFDKDLYMVFATSSYDKEGKVVEQQRERFILHFK